MIDLAAVASVHPVRRRRTVDNLIYYRGGSFTLPGLKASYQPVETIKIELANFEVWP
jgi:hypothetical protein